MKRATDRAALAAAALLPLLGPILGAAAPAPPPPLGLPPVPWPAEYPYHPERAALGRLLFFDRQLSSDGTVACATCHDPARAFTDGAPVSTGIRGRRGTRSAPSLVNRAYSRLQFWDGRAASLEEQVREPLANPAEMTLDPDPATAHAACVARLRAVPGYAPRFAAAFGSPAVTLERISLAIAAFERTLLSGNSLYDRYRAGDRSALSAAQARGLALFSGKAGCADCHMGSQLTDGAFINTGVSWSRTPRDPGRAGVTQAAEDTGAFKTPTLREIERSAPYMHDGSLRTLADVVEFYDRGGGANPYLDERMRPLRLSPAEKEDLVAFLRALGGEGWQHALAPPELPR